MGDRGREGQKRIKTESGRWISASYKSNSYKDWKERHKIDTPLVGMEEEEEQVKGSFIPLLTGITGRQRLSCKGIHE